MAKLHDREKALLDALQVHRTVKNASQALIRQGLIDMTPKKCYPMLGRIRTRYTKSRSFVNLILSYRQRSPTLKKLLTPKIPINDDDLDEEDEPKGLLE